MAPQAGPALKRSLSLLQATLYGLGVTIGAGIYVLVGAASARAGMHAPFAFLLAAAADGAVGGVLRRACGAPAGRRGRGGLRAGRPSDPTGWPRASACWWLPSPSSPPPPSASAAPATSAYSWHCRSLCSSSAWSWRWAPSPRGASTQSVSFAGVMTVIEIGGLLMLILRRHGDGARPRPAPARGAPAAGRRPRLCRHRRDDAAGRVRLHRLRGPGQRGRGGARPQAHASARDLPDAGDFHPALRARRVGRARLGGAGGAGSFEGTPGARVRAPDRERRRAP